MLKCDRGELKYQEKLNFGIMGNILKSYGWQVILILLVHGAVCQNDSHATMPETETESVTFESIVADPSEALLNIVDSVEQDGGPTDEGIQNNQHFNIPVLKKPCALVTELERNHSLNLGSGDECFFNMIVTYDHIFYPIDDDCYQCRCHLICPYHTEEEIERRYNQLISDLNLVVVWNRHTITHITIYVATMFCGSIGNLLVIITVAMIFRPVSVTNMFIASLAVADFLVSCVVVPFQVNLFLNNGYWKLSAELCKLLHYFNYSFFMASVFSLTAMSLERFFVICYPMKAQSANTNKRAKIVIVIVWVVALAMASPVAFQSDKHSGECEIRRTYADDDWSGPLFLYITFAVFAFPAFLIGYAYLRTSWVLWKSIQKVKDMKNEKGQDNKKESNEITSRIAVIRMLITIWLVFISCWGPFLIFALITIYDMDWINTQMSAATFNFVYPTLQLITVANSAINPILYAFMSRQFRRGFIKCFLCCLAPSRSKLTSSEVSSSGLTRTRVTTAVTSVSESIKQ